MNYNKFISIGFIIAGVSNILGVLICSKFLTNDIMMGIQPSIMGFFGLISILLWGAAYIAVSCSYKYVRWLIGVFIVEKLVYTIAWLNFITSHSLSQIYEKDILSGVFYSIYGPNDFIFMLFFIFVFVRISMDKT